MPVAPRLVLVQVPFTGGVLIWIFSVVMPLAHVTFPLLAMQRVMLRTRPKLRSFGFIAKKSEAMENEEVEIPEGKTELQPTGIWEGMRGGGPELLLLAALARE